MLRFLFPRLTPTEPRGTALFAAAVAEARTTDWYLSLGVPDDLDGRFSVLATVTALVTLRLEQGNEDARQASVALAERFIESMDHEHRQLGYGDPTLGKIVRRLTGALARRVENLRVVVAANSGWEEAAAVSLKTVDEAADRQHAAWRMRSLWTRLEAASDEDMVEGRWS